MSVSFLGRYLRLEDEQLDRWAYNGFAPNQLWIAPTDVIIDTAYVFIERRDLTLHNLNVLKLDLETLLGKPQFNPLHTPSYIARLTLAALSKRYRIITAEINTQELEAYYLLESLRKFPFSETRDAVRLNGFSLAGIIEYFFRLRHLEEPKLGVTTIMPLASGAVFRSLQDLQRNEREINENCVHIGNLIRQTWEWIKTNEESSTPPTIVPNGNSALLKLVPDAHGVESFTYGDTVGLSVQPQHGHNRLDNNARTETPSQSVAYKSRAVPWSSDQEDICKLVRKLEGIRRVETTGKLFTELATANAIPDRPAEIAPGVPIRVDSPQPIPMSSIAPETPPKGAFDAEAALTARKNVRTSITVVRLPSSPALGVSSPETPVELAQEARNEPDISEAVPAPAPQSAHSPIMFSSAGTTFNGPKSAVLPTEVDRLVAVPTLAPVQARIPSIKVSGADITFKNSKSAVIATTVEKVTAVPILSHSQPAIPSIKVYGPEDNFEDSKSAEFLQQKGMLFAVRTPAPAQSKTPSSKIFKADVISRNSKSAVFPQVAEEFVAATAVEPESPQVTSSDDDNLTSAQKTIRKKKRRRQRGKKKGKR